jgi:glucose/arabinose dehydrogenase
VAFDKVDLGTIAAGPIFTSITIGPDNRLYAATLTGELIRWSMNADGTLAGKTVISTIKTNNGGVDRAVIGLAFDPAATASNLILWVTHGGAALQMAPEWTGKLSKLTGSSLGTYQDVVVRFPRSYKDHMTNSIAFKPGEPTNLYITQGSINAMGAPDNAWGQRPERLLAATILKLDTTKLGTLPLDVETDKTTGTSYDPFAANAPLTIYATGVRNAYDLIWHSNGQLYVPTNGSAAGGNTPATPSPLPAVCASRTDSAANGPYTGPAVPAVLSNPVAEDDYLHRVLQGGYYGHPNPTRCEWVLNGGNPTAGADKVEVTGYPVGVQPDRNYRKNEIFILGQHFSPNGVIEWQSTVFSSLNGKLLIVRYSGGKDIVTLDLDPTTKNPTKMNTGIPGLSGFVDPLDLVANRTTGHLYVTEHSAAPPKITLLRPHP